MKPTRQIKFDRMSALDWTKPNCQLHDETGVSNALLCYWRHRLGKRESKLRYAHRAHCRPNKMEKNFGHLDFVNQRDSDLARMTGYTRERIRQARKFMGKPKCWLFRFHRLHAEFAKDVVVRSWIDKKIPIEFQWAIRAFPWMTWKAYCKLSKILGFIRDLNPPAKQKCGRKLAYPYDLFDWKLGNLHLSKIWGCHCGAVAQWRRRKNKGRANKFRHVKTVARYLSQTVRFVNWRKSHPLTSDRKAPTDRSNEAESSGSSVAADAVETHSRISRPDFRGRA